MRPNRTPASVCQSFAPPLLLPFAILVIGNLCITIGCGPTPPNQPAPGPPSGQGKQVESIALSAGELLEITPQLWPKVARAQGSLIADEQATIGIKVPGRVASVHVDLGDYVSAGTPLATLDQNEVKLQVDQNEALLQQARAAVGLAAGEPVSKLSPENAPPVRQERALWNQSKLFLARATQLFDDNALSRAELDEAEAAERVAEARYASAMNGVREKIALIGVREAELELAKQRVTDTVCVAPLNGFVQQRIAAPGAYVGAGDAIVVLVKTDPLRFRGAIPERYAQHLKVGQAVSLKIEALAEPRAAQVTRVSPTIDPRSRALAFEVEVPNPNNELRPGLFVEAEIVIDDQAEGIVIPDSAVVEFAGAEKVWVVIDGMLEEREIVSGLRRDGRREVIRGLSVGDTILLTGQRGRVARIETARESALGS